ncbi:MAG: DNA-directed RNA polymerase II, partial [Actinoplanes sp.]
MPEQPQWSERTLDMPPQDPWAEQPTAPGPAAPGPAQPPSPFSQGRAQVNPKTQRFSAEHEPTGTGWPDAGTPSGYPQMSWRWSELRRGGEWTSAAVLFAFVCWGIWAISESGSLITPAIVFL